MMYSTIESLFTGICDAIRGKDGTTDLISHQDIPERIAAISGGGGGGERYYIYKSGEELNNHSLTIHGTANSKKTEGWIYIHYYYRQVLTSDLIQAAGYSRIGLTMLDNGAATAHPIRFTKLLLRDTPDVEVNEGVSGSWKPAEDGNTYLTSPILLYPDTNILMSGTVYFDIPEGIEEFCVVIDNVNVDFYIEELWLE